MMVAFFRTSISQSALVPRSDVPCSAYTFNLSENPLFIPFNTSWPVTAYGVPKIYEEYLAAMRDATHHDTQAVVAAYIPKLGLNGMILASTARSGGDLHGVGETAAELASFQCVVEIVSLTTAPTGVHTAALVRSKPRVYVLCFISRPCI